MPVEPGKVLLFSSSLQRADGACGGIAGLAPKADPINDELHVFGFQLEATRCVHPWQA